jgi:hypothetical protein
MKTKQASSVTNYRNINIKRIIANDLIFNSPRDLVRFKALQCRESGSWLHAIPSPNIGTLLDNTSFQVCIGLRLGSNLCTPHICDSKSKKFLFERISLAIQLFQIPQYYRKFFYYKTKCYVIMLLT